MSSFVETLKERLQSKNLKIKKIEFLRDQMSGENKNYRDGVWDALTQVIMMVKEDEL